MSNYTINILKQMISAGVAEKPADCPAELWEEAQIKDAEFTAAPATGTAMAVSESNFYPSSYGLESFGSMSAQINVDGMLKNRSGSFIYNGTEILKVPFKAKLLLAETKFKRSIKVEQGGKVKYFSTYGGGVSTDGQPWSTVVANCKAINPNAYDYDSADLVLELEDPLKDAEGKVVADKGTKIGYTTSSTNKTQLIKLKKECIDRKMDLKTAVVPVTVSFIRRTNNNNQTWSILGLEIR